MKSRFDFDPTKIDDTEVNGVGADPLRIDPVRAVPDFSLKHTASLGLSQPVGMSIPPMAELDAEQRKQRELMGRPELPSATNTQPVNWSFNGGNAEEGKVPQQFTHEARKMLGTVDAMRGQGVNVNALTRKLGDGTVIEVRQIVGANGVETQTAKITVPPPIRPEAEPEKEETRNPFLWVGARIIRGGLQTVAHSTYPYVTNTIKWFKPYLYVWEPDYTKTNEPLEDPTEPPPECLFLIDSVGRTAFRNHYPQTHYGPRTISSTIYGGSWREGGFSVAVDTGWTYLREGYRTQGYAIGGNPPENGPNLYHVRYAYFVEQSDPRNSSTLLPVGVGRKNSYGIKHTAYGMYAMEKKDDLNTATSLANFQRNYLYRYLYQGWVSPFYPATRMDATTEDGGPMWVRQFESLKDPLLSEEEAAEDGFDNEWDTVVVCNPYRKRSMSGWDGKDLAQAAVDLAPYTLMQDESEFMEDDDELRGTCLTGEYAIRVGMLHLLNPPSFRSRSNGEYEPPVVQLRIRTGTGIRAQVDDYEITFNGWASMIAYNSGDARRMDYPEQIYSKYVGFEDLCPGGWYACWDSVAGAYTPIQQTDQWVHKPFVNFGGGLENGVFYYRYFAVVQPGDGLVVDDGDQYIPVSKIDIIKMMTHAEVYSRGYEGQPYATTPWAGTIYPPGGEVYREYYPPGHQYAGSMKWAIFYEGPQHTLAQYFGDGSIYGPLFVWEPWWRSIYSDPTQAYTYGVYWGEDEHIGGYGACDDGPWWSRTFLADPMGGSRKATADDPLPWGIQPEFTKQPQQTYELFPNGGARDPLAEA